MNILPDILTAAGAVIVSLIAFLKFYLPWHDRQLHNPWAEKLLVEFQAMRQENLAFHTWERATLEELRRCLERIEAKMQ